MNRTHEIMLPLLFLSDVESFELFLRQPWLQVLETGVANARLHAVTYRVSGLPTISHDVCYKDMHTEMSTLPYRQTKLRLFSHFLCLHLSLAGQDFNSFIPLTKSLSSSGS